MPTPRCRDARFGVLDRTVDSGFCVDPRGAHRPEGAAERQQATDLTCRTTWHLVAAPGGPCSFSQVVHPATDESPPSSSLLLPDVPWVFTQDDLLSTDEFLKRADQLGYRIRREDVQRLHQERQLLPLLQVVDEPDPDQAVPTAIGSASSTYLREVDRAAIEGRLRDPWAHETAPAYERPESEDPGHWWDGLLWSSWQLLDIREVWPLRELTPYSGGQSARRRTRTVVLCALTPRHLPSVRDQASIPPGRDVHQLLSLRAAVPAASILRSIGVDPVVLRDDAERLLGWAHSRDPVGALLPLLRRMNCRSWDRLTGDPAHALQLRVAAEVLLRTYEELASAGQVEPLPDFSGSMGWHPLVDRITDRSKNPPPLESILADFGLVTSPRLVLLVEGETELIHLPRLLAEFSDPRPEFIRVQRLGGVRVNPQLLARYVVTPRLGDRLGDGWMLDVPPSAIMIAVDEEGPWATEEDRAARDRSIRVGIRREVELQGGAIDDGTLDYLVHIRTWGSSGCYEFANFQDDEIVDALSLSGPDDSRSNVPSRVDIGRLIAQSRRGELPLDAVLGRCRMTKPNLAECMWPTLLVKAQSEVAAGEIVTPVVRVLVDAVEVALAVHPAVRALAGPSDARSAGA